MVEEVRGDVGAAKGENSRRVASIRGAKSEMFWYIGPHLVSSRGQSCRAQSWRKQKLQIATVACAPGAFLLDLYNIRTSVARAIAHKQQSSILLRTSSRAAS